MNTLEHQLFKLNISVHDIAEYTEYSLGWVKSCLRGKPSKPFLKAINEFIKLKEAGMTTEIKNLKEYRTRVAVSDALDPDGHRYDIANILGQVQGQNLEDQFKFFVKDQESLENKQLREKNQKNWRLAYAKEAELCNDKLLEGVAEEDRDELRILMAEQDMDDKNCMKTGAGKTQAPIKVTIQKYYEFEATIKDEHELPILDQNGEPKKEIVSGWMNLTSRDLGLGDTHKGIDLETGKEYRIPHKWFVENEDNTEKRYLYQTGRKTGKQRPLLNSKGEHVYVMEKIEGIISKGANGRYSINVDMLKEELDFNLVYRAGRFTDLVVLDGEEYRMKVQHSLLGEAIGIDYSDDPGHTLVNIDGEYAEGIVSPVVFVQPKEQFAKDVNKYKHNLDDSQKEIMFGRSADVMFGTTQLFYSEWQERCKQLREERDVKQIGFRAKVTESAAKTKAMASPYYTVVLELNKLFSENKYKEMILLAKEHKDNADDILSYARANKKYASLKFDKSSTFPSPYVAVRKYATKPEKKVESKASLIDEQTAKLVRELKKTGNKNLITKDNAKDVIRAARAGGEFRMDGDYKALYLYARDISKDIQPKTEEVVEQKPLGAKERAEARKAARQATKSA